MQNTCMLIDVTELSQSAHRFSFILIVSEMLHLCLLPSLWKQVDKRFIEGRIALRSGLKWSNIVLVDWQTIQFRLCCSPPVSPPPSSNLAWWRRSCSGSVHRPPPNDTRKYTLPLAKGSLSQSLHSGLFPFEFNITWRQMCGVSAVLWGVVFWVCVCLLHTLFTFHGIQRVHLLQSRVADKPDGLTVAFVV